VSLAGTDATDQTVPPVRVPPCPDLPALQARTVRQVLPDCQVRTRRSPDLQGCLARLDLLGLLVRPVQTALPAVTGLLVPSEQTEHQALMELTDVRSSPLDA
jgi:hypothetical protein